METAKNVFIMVVLIVATGIACAGFVKYSDTDKGCAGECCQCNEKGSVVRRQLLHIHEELQSMRTRLKIGDAGPVGAFPDG